MFVCICNRITEKELRAVARAGATSPERAYACFDKEPQCGCCLDHVQDIIDEERRACSGCATAPRPKLRVVSKAA